MKSLFTTILISIAFLTLYGCAKQGMPTGGPKDTEPPRILSASPANSTLNFNGDEFYIAFDEYVVLKDVENNILVSPPLKNKPEYRTKGKGVQVRLKDTLLENTTYLFQFKNAIADFNEGNLLPSLNYVFSTGSYIDSMTVGGRVTEALTHEPLEDAVSVWLMSLSDGEIFMTTWGDSTASAPTIAYTTRCDKDGTFRFNHIRPGTYNIFAIKDENKNQQLDPGEGVAFLPQHVEAKNSKDSVVVGNTLLSAADIDTVQLFLFTPKNDKQRITSSNFVAAGKIRITSMLPMTDPTILSGDEEVTWHLNKSRDTLTLWTFRQKCDSIQLIVSDPSGIQDTMRLRWRPKKAGLNQLPQNNIRLNYSKLPFFDTLAILFSTPLAALQSGDSIVTIMRLKDSSVTICSALLYYDFLKAAIPYNFIQGEKYAVSIAKGRLKDLYNQDIDSLRAVVEVSRADDYGNLKMQLVDSGNSVESPLTVQLLDEKGKVLSERSAVVNDYVEFKNLKPAKYRIRAIVDDNGNGKWDTGDFAHRLQPERVLYFPKILDIRANWDFDEKFEVGR
ncbi:MAG: Ig-like domain-containing protein [Bacteroidales bacterium]|nr:Ig-like domain-containing protein [Bacteroidales bacterium]